LLRQVGLDFEVMVSEVDENIGGCAEYRVRELALRKARAVADKAGSDVIVIGADTLVSVDEEALEKPSYHGEAFEMLKSLSGRKHQVYTGVAVVKGDVVQTFVEKTDVFFRTLTDEEINDYISTGEPFDKAGGYGIQGRGALFVERIEGDFYTVMGLPLCRLFQVLHKTIW